jgi:hypothetical protein
MGKTSKTKQREHDFSRGIRGKHAGRLKNGHKTVITKADGTIDSYTTRPFSKIQKQSTKPFAH